MFERVLTIPDGVDRADLTAFVAAAARLDEAAVIRMRTRAGGAVSCWAETGFETLAARVVRGSVVPDDTSAGADVLLAALRTASDGVIDPGFSMDSAWRGALPPDDGFEHIDDVPARVLVGLARRGVALAREHGSSHGPPTSLLGQEVLHVDHSRTESSGAGGSGTGGSGSGGSSTDVSITMRTVFGLVAMGFVPSGDFVPSEGSVPPSESNPMPSDLDADHIDPDELVRVRATPVWLRLDARYGSVFSRRAGRLTLSVES